MAYPDDQDEFRTAEDIQGLPYDAEDTKTLFAKDYNDVAEAIQNIEDFVGYEGSIDESPLYLLIADLLYPIGKIVEFSNAFDPNTSLGFGTWEYYGKGRVTAGYDSATGPYDTIGAEIGNEDHSHELDGTGAQADMVIKSNETLIRRIGGSWSPTHKLDGSSFGGDSSSPTFATGLSGDSKTESSLQPTMVVARWVRTA